MSTETAAEIIHVPNTLQAKVGPRRGDSERDLVAKAEGAMKELSWNFSAWLEDAIEQLGAARRQIGEAQPNDRTAAELYRTANELKGLAATYKFPLIGRMAASLCRLMGEPESWAKAPLRLVDAHIEAIRAAHRDNIRDAEHPVGRVLAEELERQVGAYASAAPRRG